MRSYDLLTLISLALLPVFGSMACDGGNGGAETDAMTDAATVIPPDSASDLSPSPETGPDDAGSCVPDCLGPDGALRVCGDDGCGTPCGVCPDQALCQEGACVPDCVSACAGLQCGDGGTDGACDCGACDAAYGCTNAGTCALDCPAVCASLGCTPAWAEGLCDCGTCDGGAPCSDAVCQEDGTCLVTPLDGVPCEDGVACTEDAQCIAGVCVGEPKDCDDGNPCTLDACNLFTDLCTHGALTGPCDDGDPCTTGDLCLADVCTGTPVSDCTCQDDGDCAALEDDDLCNGTVHCDSSRTLPTCALDPATVVECPDPDPEDPDAPCLAASCDPGTGGCGFEATNDGVPCADGDLCTANDICNAGTCTGTQTVTCDDGDPCTDDSCAPATGCVHVPNTAPCDDGDPCTVPDQCADGVCVPGLASPCDDGDPCTLDTCDAGHCDHAPVVGECNDGDLCTQPDQCVDGVCIAGPAVTCDDGDACTLDGCAPESGCTSVNQPVDCVMAAWGDWGSCSVSCGGGEHTRTREILQEAACGGAPCGALEETEACNAQPCSEDCQWHWDAWSACEGDCPAGTRSRSAVIDVPAQNGGEACPTGEDAVESESCDLVGTPCDDLDPCTQDDLCAAEGCAGTDRTTIPIVDGGCDDGDPCTLDGCTVLDGCTSVNQPVDCVMGAWGDWSPCSEPCDGGERTRTREVVAAAACDGAACGALEETEACNAQPCSVDCQWHWGAWSGCEGACPTGIRIRSVIIDVPAQNGGEACPTGEDAVESCDLVGTPCDDLDPCTLGDLCAAEGCAGIEATTIPLAAGGCDDDDPCTRDTCEDLLGAPMCVGQDICVFSGACCWDAGCVETEPEICALVQGTFQAGIPCIAAPCAAPGTSACCVTVGCAETDPGTCVDLYGGVPHEGLSCGDVGCPAIQQGACCTVDGCTETDFFTCEQALQGQFHADTTCADDPCAAPPPGACCTEAGCADTDEFICVVELVGTFFPGSACAEAPCIAPPVGACCWDGGCDEVDDLTCIDELLGQFLPGATCLDDPCSAPPLGACCWEGGCDEVDDLTCFESYFGQFLPDATCLEDPCSVPALGACCWEGGCDEVDDLTCIEELLGQFLQDSSCVDDPCAGPAQGACCWEGGCDEVDDLTCIEELLGQFLQDSSCVDDPCAGPAQGACCWAGGCEEVDALSCQEIFGDFHGGALCGEISCIPY